MIIDHNHPKYLRVWSRIGANKYNGAYYYSKEIVKNIIPNVKTDRNWLTVEATGLYPDHSIVFVHNRLHPEWYKPYRQKKDVILVCSVPELCKTLNPYGRTIYLPLSIDVAEVEKYRCEKDREAAYVGRAKKLRDIPGSKVPAGVDIITGIPRELCLAQMARYRKIYGVDRVALEALVLGCEILPYEPTYPDPSIWKVLDNKEAAVILQEELDKIDG